MTTVHANSTRDALVRLENMVGMAGFTLAPRAVRQQIASAITAVVQIARLSDGRRKVVSLQEITGMEGDIVTIQEIFAFAQTGVTGDGTVEGYFHATGIRPKFAERLRTRGIHLSEDMFDPERQYR
jgi:pilus assembly protein CpaF